MNPQDVQLIGVFDTPPPQEHFCYSVDLPAPANLWIQALTADGTRMHSLFMGFVLNSLIAEDKWHEGDHVDVVDQSDVTLRATVTYLVPSQAVEAFASQTGQVRIVTVKEVPGE